MKDPYGKPKEINIADEQEFLLTRFKPRPHQSLKSPSPEDILKLCARLQKAGADLSKMGIVYDPVNIYTSFYIIDKRDLRRNKKCK